MITPGCIRNLGWTFSLAMFLFVGCGSTSPPVEFYTLASLTAMSEDTSPAGIGANISVGVGPLSIPKTIDRPQIVTRTSTNKLNLAEFHRWGGSLHEDFLRVLSQNLSILLRSNRVAVYPWEEYFDPSFRIFLKVHQFDGRLDEYVFLNVTWTVTGRDVKELLLVQKSSMKEPVSGPGYEAFVSAKSQILAKLSREIADAIRKLQLNTPAK
jgi:uncharacterized lipoprotein YmbA